MAKPTLTTEAIFAALVAGSAAMGIFGCSRSDAPARAVSEPAPVTPGAGAAPAPQPVAASATAAATPEAEPAKNVPGAPPPPPIAAPTTALVDAGKDVPSRRTAKPTASMTCSAQGCSPDMKKQNP